MELAPKRKEEEQRDSGPEGLEMGTGGLEQSRTKNRAQTHGINDVPKRLVTGRLILKICQGREK